MPKYTLKDIQAIIHFPRPDVIRISLRAGQLKIPSECKECLYIEKTMNRCIDGYEF